MDETKRALADAVRFLAHRDRSEAELARKLSAKGFPQPVVVQTVSRLKEMGYLDDRRFAAEWAGAALRNGRRFGQRIRLELLQRGVAEPVVAEVMAELAGSYDETELISELLRSNFPAFTPAEATDREKRRIMDYFRRRGFSCTAILAVFRDKRGC